MRFDLERLEIIKDCPTYGSVMIEGKFRDTIQEDDVYVYANISDFDCEDLDDADIYVYPFPFESLYDASEYDITEKIDDAELCTMREMLLEKIGARSKSILTDDEKEYLRAVIEPFKFRVINIAKQQYVDLTGDERKGWERIVIATYNDEIDGESEVILPYFPENTRFRGMNPDEEYSLKELEIPYL